MEQGKIRIMPGGMTRTSAKAGIVAAVLFLLFGLVFGGVILIESPGSEVGMKIAIGAFFFVWVAVCIAQIFVFLRVLSRPAAEEDCSLVDLHLAESNDAGKTAAPDFDERLRKLEQLRKDGLITEAEFQGKREQLLGERW